MAIPPPSPLRRNSSPEVRTASGPGLTRDLGPGSYADTTSSDYFDYPNKNGDIKIEANVEYRFKVFWKMEGAIFLDAGNIWALKEEESRPGAEFKWNRFYREIAVGTGLGVRFDFSFFCCESIWRETARSCIA